MSSTAKQERMIYMYSKEFQELIQQAAQRAKQTASDQPIQSIYHQPWLYQQTDATETHSSSSSSSSSEEEEEELDKLTPLVEESLIITPNSSSRPPRTKATKTAALTRSNLLGTPTYHDLPLDDSTVLSIPNIFTPLMNQNSSFLHNKPIVVILLRSGRLAAAMFQQEKCIKHTTSTRYTIRKGQGKAQSTQDGQQRAQSIGSQLRRQGQLALRSDVVQMMADYTSKNIQVGLILLSVPKTMLKDFFQDSGLDRDDARIYKIPLDTGRPTFEAAVAVYDIMMRAHVREKKEQSAPIIPNDTAKQQKQQQQQPTTQKVTLPEPIIPLTPLHEFAKDANLADLLSAINSNPDHIHALAGADFMTPLHYAATHPMGAACVTALLLNGHADPTLLDARLRVPYFCATHDTVRDAFRKARATLGEDYCDWNHDAKVGPPLTEEDVIAKKLKVAEKKKRQKARQKETKAKEIAMACEAEERRKEEEERERSIIDAKRIRDGLQPKKAASNTTCDFCQTVCRRRNQMLVRLEYAYCSTECVNQHKRELMATAALARFAN